MRRHPTILERAALAGAATALAAVGVGLTPAGAQAEPVFSVTPALASVGESLTITATGCVAEGVDQADLEVFVYVAGFDDGDSFPTDGDGGMTFVTPPLDEDAAGQSYAFSATCFDVSGEEPVTVFTYTQVPTVIIGPLPTTTTTATAQVPAPPVAVAPSFTG